MVAVVAACSAVLLAACGGQAGGPAVSASPTPTAAGPVVLAQSVGTMGTILVAASNMHTVYTFDSDSPGASKCNAGCAGTWPPLSIASGGTATGGAGVAGALG